MYKEIISNLFKENVDKITKIKFSRHAFMSEEGFDCNYTLYLEDEIFIKVQYGGTRECLYSKKEILDTINDIEMWKWRNSYSDKYVYDGEMWEIEVCFDYSYIIKYSGRTLYPKGYKKFIKIFGL